MTGVEHPKLVVVGDLWPPTGGNPLLDYQPPPPVKPVQPRIKRAIEPFMRTLLSDLTERRMFSPVWRLYLLLGIDRDPRRRKPVRLTNSLADTIGLSRKQKLHHLRQLEKAGFVTVTRERNTNPIVTFMGGVK
jgi:hypothetical protein